MGKKLFNMCVILYYHAITRDDRPRFARQLDLIKRLAKPIAANTKDTLIDSVHHVVVTFDDGFQSILENAIPDLIERGIHSTIFFPAGNLGRQPDWIRDESQGGISEVVMTEEQIRDLPPEHILVGSHTMTHPNLRSLEKESVKREVVESKEKLEKVTGQKITMISLPYGEYDERALEVIREAGYEQVFSSHSRFARKRAYLIERVLVKPSDWSLELRLKILGGYQWLAFALGLKQKLWGG